MPGGLPSASQNFFTSNFGSVEAGAPTSGLMVRFDIWAI